MSVTRTIASEAELIQTYLAPLAHGAGSLSLKDDAAYFAPPPGADIVVTTDPIVSGLHFLPDERADDIAWKALAVNISDLAAKGAVPLAYTMALAFPAAPTHDFMQLFARGLADAQAQFGCVLLGGDTDRTPGPFSVSITAFGAVPSGRMVKRMSASVGDHLFVSGTLGDAALGLVLHRAPEAGGEALTSGDRGFLMARYLRPQPRIELAAILRSHASAALDISDGLVKDLTRLAEGAGGGAVVRFADLPLSSSVERIVAAQPDLRTAVTSGGDDYEILFSVPPSQVEALHHDIAHVPFRITQIGVLDASAHVAIVDANGEEITPRRGGWDHFS